MKYDTNKDAFLLSTVQECLSISITQKQFARIFPEKILPCFKDKDEKNLYNRMFNGKVSGKTTKKLIPVIGSLRKKDENSPFDESKLFLTMKTNFEELLKEKGFSGSAEEAIDCESALRALYQKLGKNNITIGAYNRIKAADATTSFISMILVALTWKVWATVYSNNNALDEDTKSTVENLLVWIIPGDATEVRLRKNPEWHAIEKQITLKNDTKRSNIQKAKSRLNSNEFEGCFEACAKVIADADKHLSDEMIGQAYYYAYLCCKKMNLEEGKLELTQRFSFKNKDSEAKIKAVDLLKPLDELTAADLLRRAVEFGCAEAIQVMNSSGIDSLVYVPSRTAESTSGIRVICNSKNVYSSAFIASVNEVVSEEESIPEADDALLLDLAAEFCAKDKPDNKTVSEGGDIPEADDARLVDSAAEFCAEGKPKKGIILLCDEDLHRNFKNLLSLLSLFKRELKGKSREEKTVCTIYIRTEERYDSLIDTAIKQIANVPVRVIPIDAHKLAAQQLLGLHPLFYSIRDLDAEFLKSSATTLNFVIVGDNDNDLNIWLIREAYWLGCFMYTGITLKITLLSPKAENTIDTLRGMLPGMFEERRSNESAVEINAVELAELRSEKLIKTIDEMSGTVGSFFYFAVNAENCVDGLETARRLREWSLRRETKHAVETEKPIIIQDLPVVAFYCDDDDVAHLTDNLSVQGANHGNAWYNDLRLIPFGTPSYIYGFDTIGGGKINKLAECVHLQYCGANSSNFKNIAEKELDGFYGNVYDRDSSIAAALSMPCRLFHAGDTRKNAKEPYSHVVPKGWSIRNANAYTDGDAIKEMMELFDHALKNEKGLLEKLTEYEHARWMRFMVSRGWVASTPAQALMHMKNGSPKHQLFAARMHPCITPSSELAVLQNKLRAGLSEIDGTRSKKYKEDGALVKIDRSSIESTAWIIRQAWLPDMVKADDDKELE